MLSFFRASRCYYINETHIHEFLKIDPKHQSHNVPRARKKKKKKFPSNKQRGPVRSSFGPNPTEDSARQNEGRRQYITSNVLGLGSGTGDRIFSRSANAVNKTRSYEVRTGTRGRVAVPRPKERDAGDGVGVGVTRGDEGGDRVGTALLYAAK